MNKKTATNWIAIGLFMAIGANIIRGIMAESSTAGSLGEGVLQVASLIGAAIYVVGLCFYSRAKGHNWAWGLTGLLCLVGGISVAFLKDRSATK